MIDFCLLFKELFILKKPYKSEGFLKCSDIGLSSRLNSSL